ncbi:MAG: PorP/SprF family type IX secretion system membrane protein [Bacteroidota bacterium]
MKKYLILASCMLGLWWGNRLQAQDPHFSQFRQAPVFFNPAYTGRFEGQVRLAGNYRNQWASVTTPFKTTFASLDLNMGKVGMGFLFSRDGAGEASMTQTNALAGLSYYKTMGDGGISLGFQAGLMQKSFNPNLFRFDDQYDIDIGFDPTQTTQEVFPTTRLSLGDVNVGAAYVYRSKYPRTLKALQVGLGMAHINAPNFSFLGGEARWPSRMAANAEAEILTGKRTVLVPAVLYMSQGSFTQLNGGVTLNYELENEIFLHFGGHYRLNDAIIPSVGITLNRFHFGFSYDINTSRLAPFSRSRGGFELSMNYIVNKERTPKSDYAARKKSVENDRDQDGVKDHRDVCPDIAGPKKFGGCPDTDGDGLIDSEDNCPMIAGPEEYMGCPQQDRDGDGVMDPADKCPDTPGLVPYRGCPDTDGDGLPDNVDKCPNEAGPKGQAGCPSSDIDADGDGIPDKIDSCPNIVGLAEFQGCPDTDEDGVTDFEDQCPLVKGSIENKGCPVQLSDMDKDGIMDTEDKCPYTPGMPEYAGCPDSDGDGIPDSEDKCPLNPGPRAKQGCPDQITDADGDGIADAQDKCPSLPGMVAFNGCPDSDQDGIPDPEDQCPITKGLVENRGCPAKVLDADGDGIPNQSDQCPYVPGLQAFQGCPDTDNDGLPDTRDACPLMAGPIQFQGCPQGQVVAQTPGYPASSPAYGYQQPQYYQQMPIRQQQAPVYQVPTQPMQNQQVAPTTGVVQRWTQQAHLPSFGPVEFDLDKYHIKAEHARELTELATYMNRDASLNLVIVGHTDDQGGKVYNMVLGFNRAQAIINFLGKLGVDQTRISTSSQGKMKPKESNTTEYGKARNRRAELYLVPGN